MELRRSSQFARPSKFRRVGIISFLVTFIFSSYIFWSTLFKIQDDQQADASLLSIVKTPVEDLARHFQFTSNTPPLLSDYEPQDDPETDLFVLKKPADAEPKSTETAVSSSGTSAAITSPPSSSSKTLSSSSSAIRSTTSTVDYPLPTQNGQHSVAIVIGHLASEADELEWLHALSNIERKAIYIVDNNASTSYHLERNHGRESMVYLRYILDHYDNLTDVTMFMHPHENSWHNNMLLRHNSTEAVRRLNRTHVQSAGYLNLRCDLYPGCPRWIHVNPTADEHKADPGRVMDMFTSKLWYKLFPSAKSVPDYLSAPCCSQFAVSASAIRKVPRSTFQRIHDWLDAEDLDLYAGRVLELVWHYIFTGEAEVCPSMHKCYCQTYGVCFEQDGTLETWNAAAAAEGKLGADLARYDDDISGGLVGEALEKVVKDDQTHRRMVKEAFDARTNRMETEAVARQKHAVPNP